MLTLEIIGNLGNDAVEKTINEKRYISFDVAHRNGKDKPSTWVQVLEYGNRAQGIMQYLKKGTLVFVRGNLSVSTYQAKNGETKLSLSVFASELQLLRTSESNMIAGARDIQQAQMQANASAQAPGVTRPQPASYVQPDDDLPF